MTVFTLWKPGAFSQLQIILSRFCLTASSLTHGPIKECQETLSHVPCRQTKCHPINRNHASPQISCVERSLLSSRLFSNTDGNIPTRLNWHHYGWAFLPGNMNWVNDSIVWWLTVTNTLFSREFVSPADMSCIRIAVTYIICSRNTSTNVRWFLFSAASVRARLSVEIWTLHYIHDAGPSPIQERRRAGDRRCCGPCTSTWGTPLLWTGAAMTCPVTYMCVPALTPPWAVTTPSNW